MRALLAALQSPRVHEALLSLLVLGASYLGARFVSFLLGLALGRVTRGGADGRLLSALKQPVTWALFLVGAWAAVHRLPAPGRLIDRLDALLFAVGVLVLTLALARSYAILLDWYVARPRHESEGNALAREFGPLFGKVGKVFIALVAASILLQHFGLNVASLVVSLGVGSLAVGLAAQDTLANMFAGFTLLIDRPFRAGDRIQLATGEVGDVEAIGMRATLIRTTDHTLLVVPNSVLVKERLQNLSRPTRHVVTRVEVAVAWGTDLAKAKRVLAEAALLSPHVDRDPPPVVLVTRFAESAVNCLVVFWVRDLDLQALAKSEVHEAIYGGLARAGIEIPLPTRRIVHETAAPDA